MPPSDNSASSAVPGQSRPWSAFLHRDYRVLWLTMVITATVFWMRTLGTAQWLLDDTGSAVLVGFIGLTQLIVQVPALLWGGTLADRIDRRHLMAWASMATAAVLLVLGYLNSRDLLTPPIVYLGIGLSAAAQVLATPASTAMIPIVVPQRDLLVANSTNIASAYGAAIVGPLLFAWLAGAAGLTTLFLVTGVLAIVAAAVPLLIRARGTAAGETEASSGSALQQAREGFRYVARHPILPGLFILDVGITSASFYREILPVLALGMFAGGAGATGVLGAANSAGAIVGAVVALFLAGFRAKGMLVLYASFVYGFFLLGFGLASTLWLGVVIIAVLGGADAVTVAVRQTTVMLTTPDQMRGRAFSLLILAAQSANNIGTIWVGFWAGYIGAGNTMVLGGVIAIVATSAIWRFWAPIREFRSS